MRSIDYRMVEGFDIVGPTLREQPTMILGKLTAGLNADPNAARQRSDAVAAELRSEVPAEQQPSFDELLEEARAVYRLRDERGIYSDISAIGLLRLAMLEAGRRAVDRGLIGERDQILDATVEEAITIARRRRPRSGGACRTRRATA